MSGRRLFLVALLVLGVFFPLIDGNEGDIDAAREIVDKVPGAELFLYPGDPALLRRQLAPVL